MIKTCSNTCIPRIRAIVNNATHAGGILWTLAPVTVLFVLLAAYVLINGEHALTAEKAFVALATFNSTDEHCALSNE